MKISRTEKFTQSAGPPSPVTSYESGHPCSMPLGDGGGLDLLSPCLEGPAGPAIWEPLLLTVALESLLQNNVTQCARIVNDVHQILKKCAVAHNIFITPTSAVEVIE